MIKVSVVVPVYNGEAHLEECLDSIRNQTLTDIEIICVDDGSTDSSYEILERYKAEDDRFQIYQQENKYAGAARNLGKSHATGEYLMFWDCDDFFALDALEKLYAKATMYDADICVCGVNQYFDSKKKLFPFNGYMNKNRIPKDTEVFDRTTNQDYILNFTNEAAWNKMYKREFVEKHDLNFQCVRNGNDVYFTVCAMCLAERITTIEEPLVNYRKNQGTSLVGTLSRSAMTPFNAWMDAAKYLSDRGILPERSFVNKAVGSMIYLLRNLSNSEQLIDVVRYLQDEGLEKLHIRVQDEEYYYNKTHYMYVKHIIEDTAEEYCRFMAFATYIELTEAIGEKRLINKTKNELKADVKNKNAQIKALKKQLKEANKENKLLTKKVDEIEKLKKEIKDKEKKAASYKKENDKIRASWSFRIGKLIVWLPGKIKRIFKHK
jgi:glycosyltransferase EpsH